METAQTSINRWIKKLWYIPMVAYYSGKKKNQRRGINYWNTQLKITMLNEKKKKKAQAKILHNVWWHLYKTMKCKVYSYKTRSMIAWMWAVGNETRTKGLQTGRRKCLGVIGMFVMLILVVISWVCVYIYIYSQNLSKCAL